MIGTIVRVELLRGFGFIKPDEHGKDVFFHIQEMNLDSAKSFHDLLVGDRVSFLLAPSLDGKGPRARDVKALPSKSAADDDAEKAEKEMPWDR